MFPLKFVFKEKKCVIKSTKWTPNDFVQPITSVESTYNVCMYVCRSENFSISIFFILSLKRTMFKKKKKMFLCRQQILCYHFIIINDVTLVVVVVVANRKVVWDSRLACGRHSSAVDHPIRGVHSGEYLLHVPIDFSCNSICYPNVRNHQYDTILKRSKDDGLYWNNQYLFLV